MYECDVCQIKVEKASDLYFVNDEALCQDCFNDAVSRAEYFYEMAREDGII